MRSLALILFFALCSAAVNGCSSKSGGSAPQNMNPGGNNNPNPNNQPQQPSGSVAQTDSEVIAATPAFRNEGVVVVTRRLNTPGGTSVAGAGAVAFSEPRPDAVDANVMLVDVVVDYSYDNNTSGLVEAWVKQNAPIINNYDAVQLTPCGDNGYRGTLRVPVAQHMHFTLLKTDPAIMAGATTIDPAWFFTGLPYDSTYESSLQELRVWVAKDGYDVWQTYVKPHPGASQPPAPADTLPGGSGNPNPNPNTLQVSSVSATPSTVTEGHTFSLQASVSGGTGTLSYQWAQFAGPTASIADATSTTTAVTAPASATSQIMEFSFTATDQNGNISRTVSVTVMPVDDLNITGASATPSQVQGGASSTLSVQTSGGTGVIHYDWHQLSGPVCTIADPQTATTAVTTPTVASVQTATFAVTVEDDRDNILSNPVHVQITPSAAPNTAPVHVATTVSGVDATSSTIAALTTAMVDVAFRDDDGQTLTCALSRRGGGQATVTLVSSASAANITTFTFAVMVNDDPVSPPEVFSFDAVATDPPGLQAVSPLRQVRVHRRNRFADLPGFRAASVQVDATRTVNEGTGTMALGTVTIVSANEVDLDVFVDYPQNWIGEDISVQDGWTPHLFRNPLNGGVPADYYNGTPLTMVLDYGTGRVYKTTVRIRTDIGEHLLWATRHGSNSPGDTANVFMGTQQGRNHNYDDVDPNQGWQLIIDAATQDITLPAAPALAP